MDHSTPPPPRRQLGSSPATVAALGLGCWAIGGPWTGTDGSPLGWGKVDDEESVKAVRHALDLGVTFFDTADVYGAGHSESVLGRALVGAREGVVLATKFGNTFDEQRRVMTGTDPRPEHVRPALLASLRRLGTDHIDLYQFHLSDASEQQGRAVRDACEDLVTEGLITGYGWSTDDPGRAAVFAEGRSCLAVQHEMSVLHPAPAMLALCEDHGLTSINRSPLAMGLLGATRPVRGSRPADDLRSSPPPWLRYYDSAGAPAAAWRAAADEIAQLLAAVGCAPALGALLWLLATSPRTLPIPGFRTVEQVTANAGVLTAEPLPPETVLELSRVAGRRATTDDGVARPTQETTA